MASPVILLVAMIVIYSVAAAEVHGSICSPGQMTCKPGRTCKTNVWKDKHNCGGCTNVCPTSKNFVASCVNGVCKKECKSGYTLCDEACVKATNDVNNCGSCGKICSAPPANGRAVCVGGACRVKCNPGFSKCNGTCINLNEDVENCGSCGNGCSAVANGKALCVTGVCGAECDPVATSCNNSCTAVANGHYECNYSIAGYYCDLE